MKLAVIRSLIGAGGMNEVYHAHDSILAHSKNEGEER
jgi:hypothetical protein